MRRKSWRLGSFLIVRQVDLQPWETPQEGFIETYVDQWLRNPLTRSLVLDMLRDSWSSGRGDIALGAQQLAQVRARVLDAFRRRELVLVQELHAGRGGTSGAGATQSANGGGNQPEGKQQNSPPAQSLLRPEPEKTWIEIRLVDQQGKPVAGAAFRLKVTDGSVRTGKLDQNGSVRVPGLDPGMCEVSFPDYDAKEWSKV